MSLNESVTDEHIHNGFASLHQAMATGFDRADIRFAALENKIARLEHKMLERFDAVDARLDGHDIRLAAIETKLAIG